MKRLLTALIALAVALSGFGALAEPAEAVEPAALPGIGDVVYGFEAVETRDFPLVGATIVRFEHQKTGAELYYIANDDVNRAFELAFFTDAIDNTGLPHVFEHATLAGSEKYPSQSLWFNLTFQSYNTYMNASTNQRYTNYPIASLSEAQLLKLADFYTDSCLHPIVLNEESIYRTEAWRYRLADPDDELTIEGTVYSEMLGATTLSRAAGKNASRAMYPGSLVGNEPGGEPEHIPEMTWETLKNYHELYYHPSNCAAYLYGQFEDYTAFLKLLDDAFSSYERREFNRTDDGYTPITEPVVQSLPFPVEQGSDTNHSSEVYYGIVCPGLNQDLQEELVLNTLTDLTIDNASAMQQRLQRDLPYGSFYSYISTEGPEDAILFIARNVNPEDAEVFRTAVDESLAEIAESGFPQDQVDGVMTSLNINALLTREASDVGVDRVIHSMVGSYASSGDPWNYLDYVDALNQMDEWNRQGLYAKAVSDWLIDSKTTALVTTYPVPGLKEEKDAALAERLAEVKAGMSDEEIAAIVEASNAEAAPDDSSEYVAQLTAVTVDSLPEEIREYEVRDETDEAGVRHIDAVASVDGIGQTSVLLDVSGLPQEDIHWFQLYTNLVGELDTEAHTKAELATLISRYLNGTGIYLSVPGSGDDFNPYLRLSWIALDDDLDEGYDLMRELIFDTKVDDPAPLLEQVQGIRAGLKSSITGNPAGTLLRRAAAATQELYRYYTYAVDLDYYAFLGEVEQQLSEDPEAVTAKLKGIQEYLNNRENAVAIFAGNEASIALNRPLADAFLAAMDQREIEPQEYDLPVPAASEALVIDSNVQYNAMMADFDALGLEGFEGGLDALTSLVNDAILVPQLRDQYGVYTPQHFAADNLGMYLYAYRDPNIAETFQVYDTLADQVSAMEVSQEKLDGYILSAYSSYAMPQGELSGAVQAALDTLQGKDPEERLAWMRALKQVTPESIRNYAVLYERMSESGLRMTAGAASAINANAELFDAILNPFGAVDPTQVELTDVGEDNPHYQAARFAFENGMMAAREDGSFGVDDTATVGDIAAALYTVIGGGQNAPEEAVQAFADYGIIWDDATVDEPLTTATCEAVFDVFAYALEAEYPGGMAGNADPFTRGDLAEALQAYMTWIEEA